MFNTLVAAALISASPQAPTQDSDRELIVLIFVDAMRADHVSAFGYERPTTPTLEKLAQRGTRFARTYANAPWTRASTACTFTGMNASRHRTETEKSKLPSGMRTLASRLTQAGWHTTGFSANGNGGSLANLNKDFDLFEDPTNKFKRADTKRRCRKKYGADISDDKLSAAVLDD